MTKEKTPTQTRSIERTIEINAPVEKVWKALTDAHELMRWFPLDAKVMPGKGGSIFYSWGPPYEGRSQIEIWEPNHRLKTAEGGGEQPPGAERIPPQVATDFQLESHGGKTILRLVHSGFGMGENWEDEYDATSRGWTFELDNMKHYLENHAGESRQVIWARTLLLNTREEVWIRMMSKGGFLQEGSIENLRPGDPYAIKTAGGFELKGKVIANKPPTDFYGTVENFNNGIFCFRIERGSACGAPPGADPETLRKQVQPALWLSLWNQPNHLQVLIQEAWTKAMAKLYPEA
ncbi:SRPBCC domain-containing protein [bacterium]|nr:SRPBCC domain-containing protein [bacterium]MCI0603562.1 SRPBCC domain-containing protein [bacterium]